MGSTKRVLRTSQAIYRLLPGLHGIHVLVRLHSEHCWITCWPLPLRNIYQWSDIEYTWYFRGSVGSDREEHLHDAVYLFITDGTFDWASDEWFLSAET